MWHMVTPAEELQTGPHPPGCHTSKGSTQHKTGVSDGFIMALIICVLFLCSYELMLPLFKNV